MREFSYLCGSNLTRKCARGLNWKKLFVVAVHLVLFIIHGREVNVALDAFAETAPCTEQVQFVDQTVKKEKEVTMEKVRLSIHAHRQHKKTTKIHSVQPKAIHYMTAL